MQDKLLRHSEVTSSRNAWQYTAMTDSKNPRRSSFISWMKSNDLRVADIARQADIPYTTVDSFVKRPGAKMLAETEQKIATKFMVAVDEIFGRHDIQQNSDQQSSPYGSTSSAKLRRESQKTTLQRLDVTHTVTIKGTVRAGTWRAMKEYDQDLGSVPFFYPKLRGKTLYGLIVEGNSVNLKYPEGTTVIIASIFDRKPKNRDFVVIRNYVAVDIAEMTLKQAIIGDDGIVRYFCYSDDPEYKNAPPIVIPPRDEFAQLGYEIIGSVVGDMPRPYVESDEPELPI